MYSIKYLVSSKVYVQMKLISKDLQKALQLIPTSLSTVSKNVYIAVTILK